MSLSVLPAIDFTIVVCRRKETLGSNPPKRTYMLAFVFELRVVISEYFHTTTDTWNLLKLPCVVSTQSLPSRFAVQLSMLHCP